MSTLKHEFDDSTGTNLSVTAKAQSMLMPAIDLREYLRLLWRQKINILATAVAVTLLGYVVVASLTPKYTATAFVEINPPHTQIVDFAAVMSGLPVDAESIQTEMHIIQSRTIAQRCVSKLNLAMVPEFNAELLPLGLVSTWRRDLAAWLGKLADGGDAGQADAGDSSVPQSASVPQSDGGSFLSTALLSVSRALYEPTPPPASDDELIQQRNDNLIDSFLERLTVTPEGRSRVIRISFESEDPKLAAAAVNAVADFYVVAQLEAKFEATKRAMTWLNDRVEQLRSDVETKEKAIEEYRAQAGLLQGRRDVTLTGEKVSEINNQYVLELANKAAAEARLKQVDQLLHSPGGVESASEVLDSLLIRDLRKEESTLEGTIANLSEEYGNRHPTLVNARAQLHDLRAKIQIEVDRIVQGLRNDVEVARARTASLAHSLDAAKAEVAKTNEREVQLRSLEREANASRTLLENLLGRTKETASQESFIQADASVLSYAAVPEIASSPTKKLIYPLILATALLLGLVVAIMVEKLDLGFRSAEEIVRFLGVRSLGLVPMLSKISSMGKSPQDYILDNPQSAFGEGVRSLYTNVLLSDVVQRPKVLLMASSLPGEGKTTIAVALARMLASLGQSVLIVDCDLRRPTTHKSLKMEAGPGLSECLSEGARLEDVIQIDDASGAHILRAGRPQNFSPDQLDSSAMQKLLRNLARKYDLVILDSAPILAVSDTLFLARLADKTIFLVRWVRTRRESVALALKQLTATGADLSGVLLTMVDVKSHAQYGYADSGAYHGSVKKYYTG